MEPRCAEELSAHQCLNGMSIKRARRSANDSRDEVVGGLHLTHNTTKGGIGKTSGTPAMLDPTDGTGGETPPTPEPHRAPTQRAEPEFHPCSNYALT